MELVRTSHAIIPLPFIPKYPGAAVGKASEINSGVLADAFPATYGNRAASAGVNPKAVPAMTDLPAASPETFAHFCNFQR